MDKRMIYLTLSKLNNASIQPDIQLGDDLCIPMTHTVENSFNVQCESLGIESINDVNGIDYVDLYVYGGIVNDSHNVVAVEKMKELNKTMFDNRCVALKEPVFVKLVGKIRVYNKNKFNNDGRFHNDVIRQYDMSYDIGDLFK